MVKVDLEECLGCEACLSSCPNSAITMEEEKAVIDKELCDECLTCIDACPAEAIKQED